MTFLSCHFVPDITRLTPQALQNWGIEAVIFDLDNTLMANRGPSKAQISLPIAQMLLALEKAGIPYIVVSNNSRRNYLNLAEALLKVPVLGPAHKPRRATLRRSVELLNRHPLRQDKPLLRPNQVALVGDRPLTDIWGANRLGFQAILVDSLSKAYENDCIQFLRGLERWPCRFIR